MTEAASPRTRYMLFLFFSPLVLPSVVSVVPVQTCLHFRKYLMCLLFVAMSLFARAGPFLFPGSHVPSPTVIVDVSHS